MIGSSRSAAGYAVVKITALTFLLAVGEAGVQFAATPQGSSCASSLDKGKALVGQRQLRQAEALLASATTACPNVAEIFATLGLAYDFDSHPTEAQAAYRKAIMINPESAGFHNNLAASLVRSGNQAAGISEFRTALALEPANQTANMNLGGLYLANKQFKAALHCFQAAHVERSQDTVALLELTGAYFGAGNARAARDTADRLAKIPGLEPAVHFSLGLQLAAHGEFERAAQQFAAIPASDRDVATDLNLGMAYSELRRFQEAREAYDNVLRRDPSSPDAFLHIGLDAAATGNDSAALDWITQAHTKAPDRPDISCALARGLIRSGNFERARDLLASALAGHPNDPDLREAQGDLHLQEGRPQEAVGAYLHILKSEPRRVSARLSLASAYERLGQNDKATSELQQVLRDDPQNAAAMANLGHLALQAGQQDAAQKWINQALAADATNAMASEDKAVLLEREGKPAQAEVILQRLAKFDPKNPQIHYLLSRALAQLQRPDEAKAEFELSQKLKASPNRHGE
ncbi:MAG: tetratricopeptide repeat protein [Terriglobia bacterium]|jgi:Flp pilus assembly protein TadD